VDWTYARLGGRIGAWIIAVRPAGKRVPREPGRTPFYACSQWENHYRELPVAVAAVSPNRGTRDSFRAPTGRRTDTAEPRWNSHCQAGKHSCEPRDGPFEGEAGPHAARPNAVTSWRGILPDRDPKRAARPHQRAIPGFIVIARLANTGRRIEGPRRTGFPTRPRRGSTNVSAGAGCGSIGP
jgi:hypothetical protein